MNTADRSENEYLNLKVKPETILRLFQKLEIHVDELQCENSRTKQALSKLLLKTLTC